MDRRQGQGWRQDGPQDKSASSASSYASLATGPPPSYARQDEEEHNNSRDYNDNNNKRPPSPNNNNNNDNNNNNNNGSGHQIPFYGGRGGGGGRYDNNNNDRSFPRGDRFSSQQVSEAGQIQPSSPDLGAYEDGEISPRSSFLENNNNNRIDRSLNEGREPSRYIPRGGGRDSFRGGRGRGGRYFDRGGRGRSDYRDMGRGRDSYNNRDTSYNFNPNRMNNDDRFTDAPEGPRLYGDSKPMHSREPRVDPQGRDRGPPIGQNRYSDMLNDSDNYDRFGNKRRRDDQGFQSMEYEEKRNRPGEYMPHRNRPDDHKPRPPMHSLNDGPRQGGIDHRGFDSIVDNLGGPPKRNYDDPRSRDRIDMPPGTPGPPKFQWNDARSRVAPTMNDHGSIQRDDPRGVGPPGPPKFQRNDFRSRIAPSMNDHDSMQRDDPRGVGPLGPPKFQRNDSRSRIAPTMNDHESMQRDDPRGVGPPGPPRFQRNDSRSRIVPTMNDHDSIQTDDPRGVASLARMESQRAPVPPHRDDPRANMPNIRDEPNTGPTPPRNHSDPRSWIPNNDNSFQRHEPRGRIDPRDDQRGVDIRYDDGPPIPPHEDPQMSKSQNSWVAPSQNPPTQNSYSDLANPAGRPSWNNPIGNRSQRLSPNPSRRTFVPQVQDQGMPYSRNSSSDLQISYPDNRGVSSYEHRGGYGGRGRGPGYTGGRGRGRFDSGRFNSHGSYNDFRNTPHSGPPRDNSSSYRGPDDRWKPHRIDREQESGWSAPSSNSNNQDHDYAPRQHHQLPSPSPPSVEPKEIKQAQEDSFSKIPDARNVQEPVPLVKEEPKERPITPPPKVKPSGTMIALTRLADLEAQLEYAYAKHIQLMKKQKELNLQAKILAKLPVGVNAFKEDLEAVPQIA